MVLPVLWCREHSAVVDPVREVPREIAFGSMVIVREGIAYQSCGVVGINGVEHAVLFEQAVLERLSDTPRIIPVEGGRVTQRVVDGHPLIEFDAAVAV